MSGRRFAIVLACLSFVGLLVFFAVRDIGLKDEIIRLAVTNLPDMTMDNIKFERSMFGADWSLNVEAIERRDGVVSITSADAYRRTESGDTLRFHSDKAMFIESEKIIEMPEGGTLTWIVSDENEKRK